jgi:undecaprenyl-diphosphatase
VTLRPDGADVAVLTVAAVLYLLITADVVAGGLMTRLDEVVRDATLPSGDPPAWTEVVGLLGNLGAMGGAALVVTIVVMQLTWRWWPGVFAATELAVTGLVVSTTKYLVDRPSPTNESPDGHLGFFPSGHTATAVIGMGTIVFLVSLRADRPHAPRPGPRPALVAGVLAGALVASSSVFSGHHWLSDVLASLVVCAAILIVGCNAVERHLEVGKVARKAAA